MRRHHRTASLRLVQSLRSCWGRRGKRRGRSRSFHSRSLTRRNLPTISTSIWYVKSSVTKQSLGRIRNVFWFFLSYRWWWKVWTKLLMYLTVKNLEIIAVGRHRWVDGPFWIVSVSLWLLRTVTTVLKSLEQWLKLMSLNLTQLLSCNKELTT